MPNQTTTPSSKKYTRDDIMAMARYEYARQLKIYYEKRQLCNHGHHLLI
ncbi:hypothetical protein INT47_010420 [Mucor saturninus]|uniref:Uncharacterized protein n=1 Tax=Mucor saturninus TaxID=64648 RepID=A0A8H7V988_9FUNG|nr:hypothetical protein INT47_010420 [Mucor saturninus]